MDGDAYGSRGSRRSDEERGHEHTGRRLGDSLSPPSIVSSPSRGSGDDSEPHQPYSPVLTESMPNEHRRMLSIAVVVGVGVVDQDGERVDLHKVRTFVHCKTLPG